jgi:hypothetical protein
MAFFAAATIRQRNIWSWLLVVRPHGDAAQIPSEGREHGQPQRKVWQDPVRDGLGWIDGWIDG